MYCLGFVLDLQGRLLSVDAVAGVIQYPGVCEGDLVTTPPPPPPPPNQDRKRQRGGSQNSRYGFWSEEIGIDWGDGEE